MAKRLPGIVISDPIPLTEFDESGDTWIKFQRPRRWEQEELDAMQAQSEIIFDTETRGQVRQRDRVPWSKLESEMVCMCLVESNLADEDGELLFIPGKNCRAARKDLTENVRKNFYKIWHGMDATVAGEVVTKLQEWHPPFDWRGGQGED